ncbi:MAG TPA: hypothetical protein VFJ82_18645 [Longimicrobium sp.]|nr:hypothetical protein [Longimicrobium sp.]
MATTSEIVTTIQPGQSMNVPGGARVQVKNLGDAEGKFTVEAAGHQAVSRNIPPHATQQFETQEASVIRDAGRTSLQLIW